MNKDIDKELARFVKTISDKCESENKDSYNQALALYRRNELWYHGLQFVYWDYNSNDWAIPPSLNYPFGQNSTSPDERGTGDYYDYVINIIKAHGDNFIAALSSQIPTTLFPPADTDNPDDISTSRAYNKLSELIDNYNPIKYLFIKLLFIKYTQGIVALYTYPDQDEKYGISKVPKYTTNEQGQIELVGEDQVNRTRILLDVLGPLNLKFPYYVKSQDDMGYIRWKTDQHYALMQDIYDDDDIQPMGDSAGRYDRSPMSYPIGNESFQDKDLVTVTRQWVRPWMYRVIKKTSEEIYNHLKKEYPSGLYSVYVNKELEELKDQNLDDRWTFSRSGLTSHILSDPECQPIIHIQDMKNTVANLTVDIIEHIMPLNFADPDFLNFDKYGKFEASPDYVYAAKKSPGMRSLSDGFISVGKAQLNPSLGAFNQQLDQEAQFIFGDFPSVFGGVMGNRVPGEVYEQSKSQALQRWNLAWHEVVDVWKRSKMKATKLLVKNMADTEKFTKQVNGQYITTYIELHELKGNVGDVEPQVSEAFPLTAEQKRAYLMQLFGMANKSEEMMAWLVHPENRETISDLLSFPELHVPGTNQRLKQLIEFRLLIKSDPKSEDQSSVPIDFDIDDHSIHAQILRTQLASEIGIELKTNEPKFYLNCVLHLKEHIMAMQAQMQRTYGSRPPGFPAHSSAQSDQE